MSFHAPCMLILLTSSCQVCFEYIRVVADVNMIISISALPAQKEFVEISVSNFLA